MSSQDREPAALSRPGSALSRSFPAVMVVVALLLALWVGFGRALAGVLGGLTPVYAVAIALPVLVLHVIAAALFRRDALNYPSHAVSRRAVLTAVGAWLVTLGFGFFLPDATAQGMQSVFTRVAGAGYLELGYGFVNILGVLSVAMAVALVLLAVTELRVTARRLRGEPLTEDERLDRLEAQRDDDAARPGTAASTGGRS
ncbi:hypothetical protein [Kocuria rhizophila]|uniref:hypothetical protein n=1 Tax=Kocuria rhizophila TaxID=72000 RepID=UPI0011A9A898|nr:hypothetical protein [Kocuria rhizophila]